MSTDVDSAWEEVLAALPDGWALSVTHVPAPAQWGATASPIDARPDNLIQTPTCRSEAEALRALAWLLRERAT